MYWDEVWKIILATLASAGGISGLIIIAVKFSSNIIAERLSKKYELKMSEELERYKSNLDSKIYISKTKFDTEFNIYRELSKAFFNMVKDINIMIPNGSSTKPFDKDVREKQEKDSYSNAVSSVGIAQDILNGNAPLIPDNFIKEYNELLTLSKMQLYAFEQRWNVLYIASQAEKEKLGPEEYMRTGEIDQKLNELNNSIRDYLSKLDVLD